MAVLTDYRPIASDIRFLDPDTGERRYYLEWTQYTDDEVAVDLSASLAEGETIVDLETHLWLLASTSEGSDTNEDDLMPTPPTTSGAVVRQRIAGLTKDRYYRLFIEFGVAGNHRVQSVVIRVAG